MDLKLIYALVLTVLPVTELRAGMPIAVSYAIDNNIPLILIFFLVVLLNILVIFFVFFFLDNLNGLFMKIKSYRRFFEFYLRTLRKNAEKINEKYRAIGFLALVLFVAVPLPGTGAWSGSLIAWILGLDRIKSILSISLGVLIAGLIVFLASFGLLNLF